MRNGLKLLAVCACLWMAACAPKIGDECQSDFECGTGNLCDLTAAVPDGYCTRTPCRTGDCEDDDAVCVLFGNGESFCMAKCEGGGDCRDGLSCLDAAAQVVTDNVARCAEPPCTVGTGARSYCYVP